MIEPLIYIDAQEALAEIGRLEKMLKSPGKALYAWASKVRRAVGKNTRKRGNKKYWRNIAKSFSIWGYGDVRNVRTFSPAAGRMQYGGTIRPLHGRFLAVPINAKDGGTGRNNTNLAKLRNDKDVFTFKSKRGNIIIGRKDKRSKSKITPLFVLKKRLEQSPHPFVVSRSEIMRLGIVAFTMRMMREVGYGA